MGSVLKYIITDSMYGIEGKNSTKLWNHDPKALGKTKWRFMSMNILFPVKIVI